MCIKRQSGQFYTEKNPFQHPAFRLWAKRVDLLRVRVLEPFAGANRLIGHLLDMGLCRGFQSFDIYPANPDVHFRDTLKSFPSGYDACVTNPPWLAKNSASVRGLPFCAGNHDNLYKYALEKCLDHCPWVAALVPESFIRAKLFQGRLTDFISLTNQLFSDTDHPVGFALFQPHAASDVVVWSGGKKVGSLNQLEGLRPSPIPAGPSVKFNDPHGNVGLIALDNTQQASIRFCDVADLSNYRVRKTGRHITKLSVDGAVRIREWNGYINRFRDRTNDVLMTCYKGIRKDGRYRRRLDWNLARGIIHHHA